MICVVLTARVATGQARRLHYGVVSTERCSEPNGLSGADDVKHTLILDTNTVPVLLFFLTGIPVECKLAS